MNHESVYGHKEDRVVDPCTFQSFCRGCKTMWNSITPEELDELHKRVRIDDTFNRARGIIK